MERFLKFSESACGWIVLLGIVLALFVTTMVFVWLSYKECKAARRAEKANSADVKRLSEIAERIRKV